MDILTLEKNKELDHITVSINRSPQDVYNFVSNPKNLPKWAAGLARSEVKKEGGHWIAESPMGKVKIRFAEKNPYGVLDHDVKLESGKVIRNPMRVIPKGEGSVFTFTLIRQPGVTDEEFDKDRAAVEKDLGTLKKQLEQ